jgi:hypothetical protein
VPRGEQAAAGREWVARAFTHVEDAVYLGAGLLLAASAIALLVVSGTTFVRSVLQGVLAARVVGLLDQVLLVFMIVEILYTVQVSFREHALIAACWCSPRSSATFSTGARRRSATG